MSSYWPRLLERELKGTNDRAQKELCKRARIAASFAATNTASAASVCACVVAPSAPTYIERAFDPTNQDSLCQNAALVSECLNAISADAIRLRCIPVPWRECLPYTLLDSRKPTLVAYLEHWVRADACNKVVHVCAALPNA